jgi:ATP-dependent protease ClpP protease subunit
MMALILVVQFLCVNNLNASVRFITNCDKNKITTDCQKHITVKQIYIYGDIDHDTFQKISQYSLQIPINEKFPPVFLNSPGGYVNSGIEIGRILRLRSATVYLKDLLFPDKRAICASSCVMVAAGAKFRNITLIGLTQS